MLEESTPSKRREYVMPRIAARYNRGPWDLSKEIQRHFEANGIRTLKEGTGFIIKTDEKGNPVRVHTGKRGMVEVGFHSLRHTFVSLCRDANAPLAVVEAIVGHDSPAMTRLYTHVGDLAAVSAVAALPSILGEEPAPRKLPPAATPATKTSRGC